MATRANPLVSAAVLASTAAIAVATPVIAPSISAPTTHALAAAKVQLATFADVLSITAADISDTLFNGWGEAISPNQDLNIDWAAEFVGANVPRCDFSCTVNGPSGVVYMYLDALINGNGKGVANVGGILQDPTKPYQPDPDEPNYNPYTTPPWGVSAVNYFFEGGPGPGFQYLLSQPFGDPASPLYNPAVAGVISQAFQGATNISDFYVTALQTLSVLALQVPVVGEYVYGGISAYLGYPGYPVGLSGLLKYVTDLVANGFQNPIPPPLTGPGAATLVAAAPAPAAALAPTAPETVKVAVTSAAPVAEKVKETTPAVSAPESTPANDVKDNTPAVSDVKDSTPAVSDVEVSTPAPEVKAVEAPSVPDVTPSAPALDSTPSVPVKDLGAEIAKAEAPAAGSGTETKSATSDSKSSDAGDTKAGTPATSGTSESATGSSISTASETKSSDTGAGSSDADSAKDSGDSAS